MKTKVAQMTPTSNSKQCGNKYFSHQDAEVTYCTRKYTFFFFFAMDRQELEQIWRTTHA